jgi:hypothetical protein
MSNNLQPFQALRVTKILKTLDDVRLLPAALVWSGRTPEQNAVDGEIMARFRGRVQIADLIADDQKATVYNAGKFRFETTGIPNLKVGQLLTQEQLKQFEAIAAAGGLAATDPNGALAQLENGIMDNILLGLRQRKESIAVARILDGFSYNRLGIKMDNVSFGMPADLKITPSAPWTDHTNGKPVTDILSLKEIAQVRYGIVYDRMTIPLAAFREMIQCVEFQNSARLFLAPNVSFVNLSVQNTEQMINLAQNVLNLRVIETYDARYWSQDDAGNLTSSRFWPINKVALTDTGSDNNRAVADFARGLPTEVTVANMVPTGMIGRLPNGTYGPIGYASGEHNPPQITYWGVDRGWTRKHVEQESAVITVSPAAGAGAIVDYIPVTEPAF